MADSYTTYTKRVWQNGTTALSAENLNNIEDGLEAASKQIVKLTQTQITQDNINKAVEKVLKDKNIVTEENVKTLVNTTVDNVINNKNLVTQTEVKTIVDTTINSKNLVTQENVNTIVETAISNKNFITQTQLDNAISAAITATLNTAV